MAGFVAIPQGMMGTALNELSIKAALIKCNAGFHFDLGANLNIWHPWQDGKQGIYFQGRHICSMDRGNIPQVPVWSTKREGVRVSLQDMTYAELTDDMRMDEVEYLVDGTERPSGFCWVQREVKDRLLWIGWQASLRKCINFDVPGCTTAALSRRLGVTIDLLRDDLVELEVAENRTHLYDASGRTIETSL